MSKDQYSVLIGGSGIKMTSALPMSMFENPKWLFTSLRDFARPVDAVSIHLVDFSHARVTLPDKTVRRAVWSLDTHKWAWEDSIRRKS